MITAKQFKKEAKEIKMKNKQKPKVRSAWIWQGVWNDCDHNFKLVINPALGDGLIFQCTKCKWYFMYVSRLEPYFKPDKKKLKKKKVK